MPGPSTPREVRNSARSRRDAGRSRDRRGGRDPGAGKPQLTGPGLAAALQPPIHRTGHWLRQHTVLNHAEDHLDRPVRDHDHGIGQVFHGALIVAEGALHPGLADQEQAVSERGSVNSG
jgi:hypothetical protein